MVDALGGIRRVLSDTGALVDLRPLPSQCPVELLHGDRVTQVGEVDATGTAADDEASDVAMARAVELGWYAPRREIRFDFEFRWDTVAEMAKFNDNSPRMGTIRPSYAELEKLCADAVRVGFRRPTMLAVYDKAGVS